METAPYVTRRTNGAGEGRTRALPAECWTWGRSRAAWGGVGEDVMHSHTLTRTAVQLVLFVRTGAGGGGRRSMARSSEVRAREASRTNPTAADQLEQNRKRRLGYRYSGSWVGARRSCGETIYLTAVVSSEGVEAPRAVFTSVANGRSRESSTGGCRGISETSGARCSPFGQAPAATSR